MAPDNTMVLETSGEIVGRNIGRAYLASLYKTKYHSHSTKRRYREDCMTNQVTISWLLCKKG